MSSKRRREEITAIARTFVDDEADESEESDEEEDTDSEGSVNGKVSENDTNNAPPILQHHFKHFDPDLFLRESEAQVADMRIRHMGASSVTRSTMARMDDESLVRTDTDDPVWSLKVQAGTEDVIVARFSTLSTNRRNNIILSGIRSVFTSPATRGYIYIEAQDKKCVLTVFRNHFPLISTHSIQKITHEDVYRFFSMRHHWTTIKDFPWVRITKGRYANDLAMVTDVSVANQSMVEVRVVPRLSNDAPKNKKGKDRKQRPRFQRTPAALFNPHQWPASVRRNTVYVMKGMVFIDGLLEMQIPIRHLASALDATPDKFLQFTRIQAHPSREATFRESLSWLEKTIICNTLDVGQRVVIEEGPQADCIGTIVEDSASTQGLVVIKDLRTGLKFDVDKRALGRVFKIGDLVEAIGGTEDGIQAWVIHVSGDQVTCAYIHLHPPNIVGNILERRNIDFRWRNVQPNTDTSQMQGDQEVRQFIRKAWSLRLQRSKRVSNMSNPTPLYPTILGPAPVEIDPQALYKRDNHHLTDLKVTIVSSLGDKAQSSVKQWRGYNGYIKDYRNGLADVEISAPLVQTKKVIVRCSLDNLVHIYTNIPVQEDDVAPPAALRNLAPTMSPVAPPSTPLWTAEESEIQTGPREPAWDPAAPMPDIVLPQSRPSWIAHPDLRWNDDIQVTFSTPSGLSGMGTIVFDGVVKEGTMVIKVHTATCKRGQGIIASIASIQPVRPSQPKDYAVVVSGPADIGLRVQLISYTRGIDYWMVKQCLNARDINTRRQEPTRTLSVRTQNLALCRRI